MERDHEQDNKIIVLETNYKTMSEKIDDLKSSVEKGFSELKNEFKCIRAENEKKFVSNERFEPVKILVYGTAGILLTAIMLGLTTLVIK